MFFASPGCVAFSLGGFDIYYYGILIAVSVCIVLFLSNRVASDSFNMNNIILDISPIILLSGILGARLYYCLLNYQYYLYHPLEVLATRNGGLSIHGALFGGILALFFVCKYYKLNFTVISDCISYFLPLGQAIGRWGNFFNSEAFGYPTNLPWKLYIPYQSRPVQYLNEEYFHPTFIYSSILDLLIFVIMIFCYKKRLYLQSGVPTLIYLILYSIARIFIEFIRVDCCCKLFGVPVPVWVSLLIVLVSIFILFKKCK